jgi:hypothetical protein
MKENKSTNSECWESENQESIITLRAILIEEASSE